MGGVVRGLVAGVIGISFCSAAIAEQCNTIADSTQRLACYDAAFPPDLPSPSSSVAPPPSPPPPAADPGKWVLNYEKSKIDDSTNVYAVIESNDRVPARFGANNFAQLQLRCRENVTAAIFDLGGAFVVSSDYNNYGDITYRVDAKKAVTKSFEESTNNQALGLWSGGAAIPFIKQLFGAQKLVVRVVPYNESPVELTFDITGAEEAVKPIRKVCGW